MYAASQIEEGIDRRITKKSDKLKWVVEKEIQIEN
jgi:hypothetical protein